MRGFGRKARIGAFLAAWAAAQALPPFLFSTAAADANDVRQNVVQRSLNYAEGTDLTHYRNQMIEGFRADGDVKKGSRIFNTTGSSGSSGSSSDKCAGHTTSSCGLACCGEQECSTICKPSSSSAHGNKFTCTDPIQVSPCGKSCCGAKDCEKVCINYRFDACNGYTVTTGEYNPSGKGQKCCGKQNCRDVECGYETVTDGTLGGHTGIACCGKDDCASKECDGMTSVDSKVDPNKKDLFCCGPANCHEVECDNYITVKTPTGWTDCCGYNDCHYKECQGVFSTTNDSGRVWACCGKDACMALSLMVSANKSQIAGAETFVATASGATPGARATWKITGSGRLVSADPVFDSSGRARATVIGIEPYNQTIRVEVHAIIDD